MCDINFCPNCGQDLRIFVRTELDDEVLLETVLRIIFQENAASTALLQRKLRIGYGKAARLMDMVADHGYISPADGNNKRKIDRKKI